jgi:hypothetical protein
MHWTRTAVLFSALALLASGCGSDDGEASPTSATTPSSSAATTAEAPATSGGTSAPGTITTTEPAAPVQPAIWPAADVVFDTPEDAATDFVTEVLEVPPVLGEFREGDARSGEIEVFSGGEAGSPGPKIPRSLLLLRQLGPADGWFVIGAVSDNATITSPAAGDEVAPTALDVQGEARGFEASVSVTAFVAGDAGAPLDQVVTLAGSGLTPEPYQVTLDLADATPATTVAVIVRGGVGLETDPGDFSAMPLVIAT